MPHALRPQLHRPRSVYFPYLFHGIWPNSHTGALPASFLTARYVVLCLSTCFSFACNPLLLNYLTANLRGTSAMTLGVPMNITLATAGQIIGMYYSYTNGSSVS
jgi:hypothetical protein